MQDSIVSILRDNFSEMVVFKDLKNTNFFSILNLPSYMRDWLLQRFEDEDGKFDKDEVNDFVKKFIPKNEEWNSIKSRIVKDNERFKMLAKISIYVDVKTGETSFELPKIGLLRRETIIEDHVWGIYKDELINNQEVWGMIELGYRLPDDSIKPKLPGKIKLVSFKNFCPYKTDLDYYKDARSIFKNTEDWLDVLLSAVDYNPSGYKDMEEKLTMLTRLLPFIEQRLNLIELAPKGTGKSYVYGDTSRYGWLSSGGEMSRAKMFYDMSKNKDGLIANYDFVVLDEVQTIKFSNVSEMRGALKGYMESGTYTAGTYDNTANAGVVICGNISKEIMDTNGNANMFEELPQIFHESALIERFHGFIKGWNIPRMTEDLKICNWALNSEYFSAIMHELRDDTSYRMIVDQLIEIPDGADTRDTEAVKLITTAYLKLIFPNVRKASDISVRDFNRYCLSRAIEMRSTIVWQLGLLDKEYAGKTLPKFHIKDMAEV